ncbi:hypothetical protein HOC_17346 [Hyphomonas oceanitis SCH89]|uniref:Uncharacterized protein n=1 Tax=Hyphomonas oceanitis SCH89 TaxID=1280953 RepID=A0A059G3J8_9PROT|nr:hypothetical protein HOC_17346 [Hyphomonas oceanitis SCH89]
MNATPLVASKKKASTDFEGKKAKDMDQYGANLRIYLQLFAQREERSFGGSRNARVSLLVIPANSTLQSSKD